MCPRRAGRPVEHRVPVVFGVLTVNTLDQALERSAKDESNKGREAAATGSRNGVGPAPGIVGFVAAMKVG